MENKQDKAAFICAQGTLEGAYPSLVLGISAARLGMKSKIFFTFMGLHLVLKGGAEKDTFIVPIGVMEAIPGMSAVATKMMKKKMEQASVPSLTELTEMAQLEGVELIACKMTIEMMEVREEQLLDGVPV